MVLNTTHPLLPPQQLRQQLNKSKPWENAEYSRLVPIYTIEIGILPLQDQITEILSHDHSLPKLHLYFEKKKHPKYK